MKYQSIKVLIDSIYGFADNWDTANIYWDQITHVINEMQDFSSNDKDEYEIKRFQQACITRYMHEELGIELDDEQKALVDAFKFRMDYQ